MSNAEQILQALDEQLTGPVDLTLYGRAALQLGFTPARPEFAYSLDVDVVLWMGQADELLVHSNLWEAVERVNHQLAQSRLYISHFFEENQVILTKAWRANRIPLDGPWEKLRLHRLANEDLFLSKCMRADPLDLADARYIWRQSGWSRDDVRRIFLKAQVPDIPELAAEFECCQAKLLAEGQHAS